MRELTDGSTAIVRGAIDAGCNFFAGYPITPASPILMMMTREMPKVSGIAIQGEDEIASIGMCIGAAMSGARVMTASSAPGLSLYSENIGMAIMGEVPLVIVDVMRLGPGTGGATTVGQGDLQFIRWGTGGGYPIIALAPSSVPECYELTVRAFALAERFRCPVFLMTDKELNLTPRSVEEDAYPKQPAPKRRRWMDEGVAAEDFRPYAYHPADAVPPLGHFGDDTIVRFTGSSHDERAKICKKPSVVGALNEHLVRKIEDHQDEIDLVHADLEDGAKTLFISYGITAGAMREAVARIRNKGGQASFLTILSIWPVPEKAILAALPGIERVVVAELNHGQFRREVERIVKDVEGIGLNRVDGEMIAPAQFQELLR